MSAAPTEPDTPAVCMFLDAPQRAGAASVFGRDIAVDDWLAALLRHGRAPSYRLFQSRNRLSATTVPGHLLVEDIARARRDVDIRIEDVVEARDEVARAGCRVWHDPDGELDVAIAMRGFASRIHPVTATVHILSYRSLRHGWFARLLLQDVRGCDALICTSRAARTAAANLFEQVGEQIARRRAGTWHFGGRLDVIPLGIDTERFQPRDKVATRRALGLPEHALLITWIGRLSFSDKADLLPLVIVFARLVKACPDRELGLVIAGSGSSLMKRVLLRHAAALGVDARLHVIDPLAAEQRHLVHAAADVFVSPADSMQETFGLTPLEALACGVPQVVADWDGYRDTVVEGETGFLIPTWLAAVDDAANNWVGAVRGEDFVDHLLMAQATALDLDRLEAVLLRLIADENLRRTMGEASRRRALQLYAWPHIIARTEDLWRELVGIARSLPEQQPCRDDYAAPSFVATFGHYATSVLSPAARIALSEAGRLVLSGAAPLPHYLAPTELWSIALFEALLNEIATASSSVSFQELVAAVLADREARHSGAHQDVGRHVMWLLKYGLIRMAG